MFIIINATTPSCDRPQGAPKMTKMGVYGTKKEAQEAMRAMFDADMKLAKDGGWYDLRYGINDTMAWVQDYNLFTSLHEIFEV